jgi:hypothetical protein
MQLKGTFYVPLLLLCTCLPLFWLRALYSDFLFLDWIPLAGVVKSGYIYQYIGLHKNGRGKVRFNATDFSYLWGGICALFLG